MQLQELITQKVEWLKQAHEQNIVHKINTVCVFLGDPFVDKRYEHNKYHQFKLNGFKYSTMTCWGNYNAGAGNYNFHKTVNVQKDDIFVCCLEYVNNKPAFPINMMEAAFFHSIVSNKYLFVPGNWVNDIEEKYLIAAKIMNDKLEENEQARVARLARQLLIDPKVEV